MSKTEIVKQIEFVNALTEKLTEAVMLHEKRRTEKEQKHHCSVAEWGSGIVERGASKVQIMASIVQLRRELNVLSRMFDDWRNESC